jgi:hypothetical protein
MICIFMINEITKKQRIEKTKLINEKYVKNCTFYG